MNRQEEYRDPQRFFTTARERYKMDSQRKRIIGSCKYKESCSSDELIRMADKHPKTLASWKAERKKVSKLMEKNWHE